MEYYAVAAHLDGWLRAVLKSTAKSSKRKTAMQNHQVDGTARTLLCKKQIQATAQTKVQGKFALSAQTALSLAACHESTEIQIRFVQEQMPTLVPVHSEEFVGLLFRLSITLRKDAVEKLDDPNLFAVSWPVSHADRSTRESAKTLPERHSQKGRQARSKTQQQYPTHKENYPERSSLD